MVRLREIPSRERTATTGRNGATSVIHPNLPR